MKIKAWVSLALVASLPHLAHAGESGEVHYSGNKFAQQICKAVVDDDVSRLRVLLRTYRQTISHRYAFDLSAKGVARDFTCNNLDLERFSSQMGSQKISGYFSAKAGNGRSQVAATGN